MLKPGLSSECHSQSLQPPSKWCRQSPILIASPAKPRGEKHLHANTNDPLATVCTLAMVFWMHSNCRETRHRAVANHQLHCSTQALEGGVMCVGYQLFCFCGLLVCYCYCHCFSYQAKWMLMNSDQDYCINRFAVKKLKSINHFPHNSSVYRPSTIPTESTHLWQRWLIPCNQPSTFSWNNCNP